MEKVVLLTGVKRIGKEIALALLKEGYELAVVYREYLPPSLEGRVFPVKGDLADLKAGEVIERVEERFGRLDAFIHLASPYERRELFSLTPREFEYYFKVITESFFFLTVEAYKLMSKNEGEVKGRVVAFGDWSADLCPYRGYAHYFVAKGALHAAVKVLAKELAPSVLVNCVAPGPVLKAEGYSREKWERILSNTPLKRAVPVKDLVELTLLLLRTEGITGEVIRADGGRHLSGSGT